MKIPALFFLFALWTSAASAQLDQILAPVPDTPAPTAPDQAAASAGGADFTSVATVTAPAAKSVRNLTGDDLLNEIQKQLSAYFGLKGDLKLSFVRDWNPVPLSGKDFELTLTDYPADGITNSFMVSFKIESAGIEVGEWQIGLRAQLWQSVWVTQSRLDRGQALDRSMLNSQKIDVLRERQTLLSDDTDPDGYDVAQEIGPGVPISKQDVIERPVIHKGDVVDVVANEGLLDIRMKALALEDGSVNALIKMRNLDSSKEFNAQILNENEVRVHF
jgi:flagella basal body P-ring formation protein FlgA